MTYKTRHHWVTLQQIEHTVSCSSNSLWLIFTVVIRERWHTLPYLCWLCRIKLNVTLTQDIRPHRGLRGSTAGTWNTDTHISPTTDKRTWSRVCVIPLIIVRVWYDFHTRPTVTAHLNMFVIPSGPYWTLSFVCCIDLSLLHVNRLGRILFLYFPLFQS